MVWNFFAGLGSFAPQIIILLAEAVAAVALVGGFQVLKRKRKKRVDMTDGEELYADLVTDVRGEVHILMRRKDCYPVFISDSLVELLPVSKRQLRSDIRVLDQLIGRIDREHFLTSYENWNQSGCFRAEFRLDEGEPGLGDDVTERWIRLLIYPTDRKEYDLFIFRDVTEEKRRMFEMEERLKAAEETSDYKTKFLSRMSHEIRTPMNGIIGMNTLAMAHLSKEHAAMPYLEKSGEVSQYLLSLINDILDMSRIEAGKLELEARAFDLRDIAGKLRGMFQKNVEAKGVRFVVEFQEFESYYVVGDSLRLSQVLINLLSNAQKFTAEGEIVVTFRQMLIEEDKMNFMVRVHDTGIGMKPEFISRIFLPFEQESTDITQKYGGSGLGMTITDQMVRLMGGEIVIDSMPGQGSDFSVFLSLPIATAEEVEALQEVPETEDTAADETVFTYEGQRILMAEDNEINAEIAVSILEMDGATVEVAANGMEAVRMFAANEPGYYDFILMDIQMPVMDGREAAQHIRRLEREDARDILIFALSADAFVEDKRKSLAAGMDGHFSKPIDFEEMRAGIDRIIKERKLHGH